MSFETKKEVCTIKSIDSKIGGPWTNKKGVPQNFITGLLSDGRAFSAMVPVADIANAKTTFDSIVGKPGEFETSVRKDNQGNDVTSLWSWPGSPPKSFGGGGGGKGPYQIAYANTREGAAFTCASIQAQVALKCAVALFGISKEVPAQAGILAYADAFHAWLTKATPAPVEAPKPAETAPQAKPPLEPDAAKAQQALMAKREADCEAAIQKAATAADLDHIFNRAGGLIADLKECYPDLHGKLVKAFDLHKDFLSAGF